MKFILDLSLLAKSLHKDLNLFYWIEINHNYIVIALLYLVFGHTDKLVEDNRNRH